MNAENSEINIDRKNSRPIFLTILCILSFIGSSFWAVLSFICMVMPEWTIRTVYTIIKEQRGPKTEELLDPMQAEMVLRIEDAFLANLIDQAKPYVIIGSAVSLLLAGTSIFGVARMWHLWRTGFWFYITANLLSMAGTIYLENWISAAFILLFIGLYALNLKHLK